jgi:hypothetical protein
MPPITDFEQIHFWQICMVDVAAPTHGTTKRLDSKGEAVVSFFNELDTGKNDLFLIMASKRTMLWKEYMSRDIPQSWIPRDLRWMEEQCSWKEYISRATIGVRRSGSNSPIEEITMSTTRSKSKEASSRVEHMGHVAT